MTDDTRVLRQVNELLDELPRSAPDSLLASVVAGVRSTPQRHRWPWVRHSGYARPSRSTRPLLAFAAVVAIVAAIALIPLLFRGSLVGPAATGSPSPTASVPAATPPAAVADLFVVPFEYTIPAGSSLRLAGPVTAAFVGLIEDPGREAAGVVYATKQVAGGSTRGVAIASVAEARIYSCAADDGRVRMAPVRGAPADLLEDLRAESCMPIGAAHATTLDGWQALSASATGGGLLHNLHVPGDSLSLRVPSRLIVAQVGDETIFVQIWAQTMAELDAWLPTAMELVESIHFAELP